MLRTGIRVTSLLLFLLSPGVLLSQTENVSRNFFPDSPRPHHAASKRLRAFDRWASRVELASDGFDFAATEMALSTPAYRAGMSYPIVCACSNIPGQLVPGTFTFAPYPDNSHPLIGLVPREAGFGKYLMGDRSRVGVGISLIAEGIGEQVGLPWLSRRLNRYSEEKKGWRRHVLPLIVPAMRIFFMEEHIRGGIGQIHSRTRYLNYLNRAGIPHDVPAGAVPFP